MKKQPVVYLGLIGLALVGSYFYDRMKIRRVEQQGERIGKLAEQINEIANIEDYLVFHYRNSETGEIFRIPRDSNDLKKWLEDSDFTLWEAKRLLDMTPEERAEDFKLKHDGRSVQDLLNDPNHVWEV